MKSLLLTATTLLLISGAEAREHWGPPPACPQPKVDCCPKPCPPKPCPPKPCAPKPCKPVCKPKPCQPECPPPCDPCCPPVCFERGHETSKCCLPSAVVEPANFDVRCGWDTYFTASFIYWEVMQGGMDLAIPGQATAINPITGVTLSATGKEILTQEQEFKPGFQLGFGWTGGWDGWSFFAEYTWIRGNTHTSATAPAPGIATYAGVNVGQFGVWLPTSWLSDNYINNESTWISSKWKYGLDIVDASVSRPSYIGTRFVLEPFFGLRGLWIRQNLDVEANVLPFTSGGPFAPSREAHYNSHSWAVGPRAGLNGNWHFGYGMRFIGDASASLLFTRYEVHQNVASPDPSALPVRAELEDYNTVRPNLEFSAGFGWGSYFWCRRVHFDVAATYDFSVFWEQNMMRYLADLTGNRTVHLAGAASNMYLQGLTLKTAIEF
ncbi:MAG: hypothetical protein K1X28_10215 [Parachlamydiales bacterium]|nr:hypothetical protein [Parachlamydiales bacterium]